MNDLNDRNNRKRKSTDFIFEVNDDDCSPTSTPEIVKEPDRMEKLDDAVDVCNLQITTVLENSENTTNSEVNTIPENNTNSELEPDKTSLLDDEMSISENEDTADNCVHTNSVTHPDETTEKPLITIRFRDKNLALQYKCKISTFIQGLLDCEVQEELDLSNTELKFWKKQHAVQDEPDNCDNMFIVDTTPSRSAGHRGCYPMYSKIQCEAIDMAKPEEAKINSGPSTGLSCFNCGGKHTMRECKEKKDYRKINLARSKMKFNKSVRYHLENEQKYAYMIPGKISEKLRRALDVHRDEIPSYVYKMRTLGYPPGWLEEAKIHTDSLELFDFQGYSVANKPSGKYLDVDKIVEYPGFNMPFEKQMKDDYRRQRCPPYSMSHSKEAMLEHIDKFYGKTTTESKPETPLAPPGCESDTNSQESESQDKKTGRLSPTLLDLEMRKKQLLAELEDGTTNTSSPSTPLAKEGTPQPKDATPLDETPTNKSVVKSIAFGTPVMKSTSPFARLPHPNNFSKDITQMINFENLPDSTGKYEQMSKVIDKVRKVIKSTDTKPT